MKKLQYTFKTDTLFKMLFVKYPELLKELVASLLGISSGSIGQFTIKNPEMPPENLGDKFCRLDINMTVNGQQVDLEVQVSNEGDYPERVMYYRARDFHQRFRLERGIPGCRGRLWSALLILCCLTVKNIIHSSSR